MAANKGCGIRHVVEMTVSDYQEVDMLPGKSTVRPLRSIKKDVPGRRFIKKTVGIQDSPGEGFEPIHGKLVRYNDVEV